jgi:Pvc16 N-terminal domain
MSNTLAVAAVTSTLRYLLEQALGGPQPGPVGSARVTTLHPAKLADRDDPELPKGINVFLYQVSPNPTWSLADLPTRRDDGSLVTRPQAALDLHYLISCTGDDSELDAQRLLGRAALALATNPVLARDLVSTAMAHYADDVATMFLAQADLADQVELVKLAPATLSLEDLSRLWSVLGTPYLLSLTYTATVVLIQADIAVQAALPVRERALIVSPVAAPVIAGVSTDPAGGAVVSGTTLLVQGSALAGPGAAAAVQIGPAELAPAEGATPALLRVLVDDNVPAGVHALSVVHRSAAGAGGAPSRVVARSAAVPVLVRPWLGVVNVSTGRATLTVSPPLFAGQRATLTLSGLGDPPDRGPVVFALDPVPPGSAPSGEVVVDVGGVASGDWLARIEVDGAQSLPELDDGGLYAAPAVSVP